jgi:hypothetical protein
MRDLLAVSDVGIVCATHEVIVGSEEDQPNEQYLGHWPPIVKFTDTIWSQSDYGAVDCALYNS